MHSEKTTQVYRKPHELKAVLSSDFLVSFPLLRRISAERAYWYNILANVCKCRNKLVKPRTKIFRTESVIRSEFFSAVYSVVSGVVFVVI
jgi:hypothetical protein